jgi:hypothetical protein
MPQTMTLDTFWNHFTATFSRGIFLNESEKENARKKELRKVLLLFFSFHVGNER